MKLENCKKCKIKSAATKTLSQAELEKLENNCVEVNFKKGDIIFKQGAYSSNIIYLKNGLVKVHISYANNEQIIKIAKFPSYLGIPTTFNEKFNHYSATAIENTTVCFIDIELFKHFIFENGKFAYEIIIELCHSELNSFNRCIDRIQKNIHGRIANALLFFSDEIYKKQEFILPLSRHELGSLIDTSRESICRILSEFNNDNIIEIRGRKIKILNENLLKTISKNG
jgi:CRP/FNR family transcriptional regulator